MMKKRVAKWTMICAIIFMFCALIDGCAMPEKSIDHVSFNKNCSLADLQLPANFVIKLGGQTKYTTYDNKEIPVGEILKEVFEKRINQIRDFSTNKKDVNQYMIGIYIREYDPKIKPLKEKLSITNEVQNESKSSQGLFFREEDTPPIIVCEISISKIEKNSNEDQIIGEKLCIFTEEKIFGDKNTESKIPGGPDWIANYLLIKSIESVTDAISETTAWKDIIIECSYRITDTLEAMFNKDN